VFCSTTYHRCFISGRFSFSGEPLPVFRPEGRGFYLLRRTAVNRYR
jgi:hypothetical protein